MGDPVSSAMVGGFGMLSSMLGGITGAYGSYESGQAQQAMYNYQAGVAQINAQLAKQDAEYARAAGETEAQEIGMKGRAQTGMTRAGIAAGNISLGSASTQNVLRSETSLTQFSESVARANAAKRAFGFETTAAMDVAQAGAYQMAGRTSAFAGDIGAVSSLLGGAGSVSSKWLQGQQIGLWGGGSQNYDPSQFTQSGLYIG